MYTNCSFDRCCVAGGGGSGSVVSGEHLFLWEVACRHSCVGTYPNRVSMFTSSRLSLLFFINRYTYSGKIQTRHHIHTPVVACMAVKLGSKQYTRRSTLMKAPSVEKAPGTQLNKATASRIKVGNKVMLRNTIPPMHLSSFRELVSLSLSFCC